MSTVSTRSYCHPPSRLCAAWCWFTELPRLVFQRAINDKTSNETDFRWLFNPADIKIVCIVVFRDSKLCSLVIGYQGRPWWWKHDGYPKRYSNVSTKLNSFTVILNTVVRLLNLVVQVLLRLRYLRSVMRTDGWTVQSYTALLRLHVLLSLRTKLEKNCVRLTCQWQKQIGRRVFRDDSSLCGA